MADTLLLLPLSARACCWKTPLQASCWADMAAAPAVQTYNLDGHLCYVRLWLPLHAALQSSPLNRMATNCGLVPLQFTLHWPWMACSLLLLHAPASAWY